MNGKKIAACCWALLLFFLFAAGVNGEDREHGSSPAAENPKEAACPEGAAPELEKYDPKEIITKVIELTRGKSSYAEFKMTIYNPRWPRPRVYEMQAWEDREKDKSFIRITAPATERGKAFLKDGEVFKVYIPTRGENRPITIPPSLMLQPWMGSDFSNDDLVHQSSEIDDYIHKVVKVERGEDGDLLVVLRLDPKPEAAVVWGKILLWVRAKDYIPVREVYFDEEGEKVREMLFSEVKQMGGRKIPTRFEMRSLEEEKKGRKTVLEIKKIEFDLEIPEEVFTEKNLTRKDWE